MPGDHLRARAPGFDWIPWLTWLTPAIIIIGGPLGFRLTCYYYRKAYYRAFWRAPAACAVREPHAKYTGETRFPLILQNLHRYFFWIALVFNVILTADAVIAFRNHDGQWGHMGLGTLMLLVNAVLLWRTRCPATPAGTSSAGGSSTSPSTRSGTGCGPRSPS